MTENKEQPLVVTVAKTREDWVFGSFKIIFGRDITQAEAALLASMSAIYGFSAIEKAILHLQIHPPKARKDKPNNPLGLLEWILNNPDKVFRGGRNG